MQFDARFVPLDFCHFSYVLSAVFVAHLAGQLYRHIIERQGNFSTQMSVSGTGSSTGKSLMMSVCMLIFTGEFQSTTTSLTETTFFQILDSGKNIYGRLGSMMPQGDQ